MSRRLRVLATLAVLALASVAAALSLAADDTPSDRPSIELDAQGPLFTLQGIRPGGAPAERCIALRARGASVARLTLTGAVSGPLADALAMDVATGSGASPGEDHRCDGFVSEQALWDGTLAQFPRDGAPAVSSQPLAAGQSRVYRFRVWLPADAVVAVADTARQDLYWHAEFEPPQRPQAPQDAPPPRGLTDPAPTETPIRPPPCRGGRVCHGRLIVRMTHRGARLHGRVHAPGTERMRSLSLRLPAALPASRAWIDLARTRALRPAAALSGSVGLRPRAGGRLLAVRDLPRGTRTVLMRVRVPLPARAALVHAACRRAPVTATMTTGAGRRQLTARMWLARASCRR
ncbi:cupredoxin domain-containing protein [Conexibacter woesei]|uniref:Uncharacterized protein n=1 Tax=Conexibacter woesei (strain DSM 14684 / CCUG 47730 / CIP 108061 / JCM 11494 / NBRC 100937 / ID131577) TaxID=469383 RepID=D3F190_CONWI|nr:hypothetical protein [Conexibacter woesei]ADB52053.1 hypothetical protein Cwoe_3636 [Conexibacter woesei DSM 14684]